MRFLRIFAFLLFVLVSLHSFSSHAHAAPFEAHFIDIGYGDTILVRLPHGGTMLIDGGTEEYGRKVVNYIVDRGFQKLDVVVITHCHPDHIGGIPTLLEKLTVSEIWVNQDISANRAYSPIYEAIRKSMIPWKVIRRGESWDNLGGVKIECLHPAMVSSDPNDNSIVLKIRYKEEFWEN